MTYLRRIEQDDGVLLQGCVKARWPTRGELEGLSGEIWDALFEDAAALGMKIGCQSVSLALAADASGSVTTTHSFIVRGDREPQLRSVLAAFVRADAIGAANVTVATSAEELEQDFLLFDHHRLSVRSDVLPTTKGGSIFVFVKVRFGPMAARILRQARLLASASVYQVAATPWRVPTELYRAARVNAAEIEEIRSVPRALRDDQTRFAHDLASASYHVEECFGTPDASAVPMLRDSIASEMQNTVYATSGAPPEIVTVTDEVNLAMTNLVHPFVMYDWPAPLSQVDLIGAAGQDEVIRGITCDPIRPKPNGPGGGSRGLTSWAAQAPSATASDDFLFVSYSRANGDSVYPIIQKLGGKGVPIWYDLKNQVGEEWDVELENRLRSCRGILAFLSPNFVNSRICRREIKYGDALGKPLYPIMLSEVTLGEGLAFLLHSTQHISASESDFLDKIVSAVGPAGASTSAQVQ